MELTDKQRLILKRGAEHRDGVVGFGGAGRGVGFQRRAWQAHIDKMVAAGLLEPNAYGDYYITDAGRAILESLA